VALRADLEIGGTDQRFNLLAGRALQERYGMAPQGVLMNPLIAGTDGRKMSSSWGNTINLTDEPNDMYGKVMSVRDDVVFAYFTHCTRVPLAEVADLEKGVASGATHPKEAKMRLAREIVTLYYSADDARHAEEAFTQTFSEGGFPSDAPEVQVEKGAPLFDAVEKSGLVSSKGEWRRLVAGGGVRVHTNDGERVVEGEEIVEMDTRLQVGKRRFLKIVIV
jgi:tyrosyl-tRNA synthetase